MTPPLLIYPPHGSAQARHVKERRRITSRDVYFVTTTFRNKKLIPTMFHFELDSEGDILKFSSNSIASPEGWGNWELDILPNLRRLTVSCVSGFPG